jgi:hypothetical protein
MHRTPPTEEGAGKGPLDPAAGRRARESDLLRELDEVTGRRPVDPICGGGQIARVAEDGAPPAADGTPD